MKAKINSLNSVISAFSYDVEKLITATAPAKWADGVLRLYETYVTKIGKRGNGTGVDENTIAEFNRQRKFMERSVKALKRESNKAAKQVSAVKKKAIVENAELMEELNESRHTCRRLRQEVEKLQSKLQGMQTRDDMRKRLNQFKSKNVDYESSSTILQKDREDPSTIISKKKRRQDSRGSAFSGTSNGFDRPTTADSIVSNYSVDDRPQTASSIVSEYEDEIKVGLERSESNADEHRGNVTNRTAALNQLKRGSQMSRNSNLPRPASSIMLRSQQRPKSGGRPYTASERRRAMFGGGSLAKSMENIREKRVFGSPEKLLELETSEMQNVAQGLQIENLRARLGHALNRTQALETVIAQNGVRLDVGGRVRVNKERRRPKSSHATVRDQRGILKPKNDRKKQAQGNGTSKKSRAKSAGRSGMSLKASIVVTKHDDGNEQNRKK